MPRTSTCRKPLSSRPEGMREEAGLSNPREAAPWPDPDGARWAVSCESSASSSPGPARGGAELTQSEDSKGRAEEMPSGSLLCLRCRRFYGTPTNASLSRPMVCTKAFQWPGSLQDAEPEARITSCAHKKSFAHLSGARGPGMSLHPSPEHSAPSLLEDLEGGSQPPIQVTAASLPTWTLLEGHP